MSEIFYRQCTEVVISFLIPIEVIVKSVCRYISFMASSRVIVLGTKAFGRKALKFCYFK